MGNNPLTLYTRKNQFKPDSVVVIAGATSGMGRELAVRYAQRGCQVVLGARNLPELKRIAEELNGKYKVAHVVPVQTDVTQEHECKRLVDTAVSMFGRIDILILNASASIPAGNFEDMQDLSVVNRLLDVNLYAQVYLTRFALPHLKKTHGQLVISSSLAGEIGLLARSSYCASKFAATGFFEALRMEVGNQVDITILCPPSVLVQTANDSELSISPTSSFGGPSNATLISSISSEPTANRDLTDDSTTQKRIESAIDLVMMGIDTRMKKLLFPQNTWLAIMARPFVPDIVDGMIIANGRARL